MTLDKRPYPSSESGDNETPGGGAGRGLVAQDTTAPPPGSRHDCCWHSAGPVPDDVVCCLCDGRSCGHRSADEVLSHERWQTGILVRGYQRAIDYALEHGHREGDPWGDEPCPPECRASASAGSVEGDR